MVADPAPRPERPLVALTLTYFHGTGGHKPAEGFKASGSTDVIDLPGIVLASLATLCLGAVLGPEAPLIAIGSGLGVLAVHLVKKDAPPDGRPRHRRGGKLRRHRRPCWGRRSPVPSCLWRRQASAGHSSVCCSSPGCFRPASGRSSLWDWTGGPVSARSRSASGKIPHFGSPTGAEFLWAIAIGVVAAFLGLGIKRGALALQPVVEKRKVLLTPLVGLVVAGLAIAFAEITGKPFTEVLFSGQSALPGLIEHAGAWTVGPLAVLILCKGLAYSASLSSFRGGPIFPGMFLGGALGILLSHLPGLPMIAGVGMGIGAVTVAMLGLPLVSVLLAALLAVGRRVVTDAAHHRGGGGGLRRQCAPGPGTGRRPGRVADTRDASSR